MIARIESQPTIPVQHVNWFTTFQNCFAGRSTTRRERQFSFLRIFSLAGLFVSIRGQLFPTQLELASLNGTNGFTFSGDQAHSRSGYSVSSAGDVNGDGVADLLIGAYLANPAIGREAAGKSYVVFGKAGLGISGTPELSSLNGIIGFTLNGASANDFSGYSVSSAGDVNGDGVSDLVIGAPMASPDSTGRAYVVFGKQGLGSEGVLELSSLNGTAGFTLLGDRTQDQAGRSVSGAGDVNGDGVNDFIIGASRAAPAMGRESAGKTYVVFGRTELGSGGAIKLASLNGTNGFVLNGDKAGDRSGISVSSAGDVNGDGVVDLVIGARFAAPAAGRERAGKTYVVFGGAGLGLGGALGLSCLDGTTGFTLNGDKGNDQSGYSVSTAGDVNGDGVDDLLIGAYNAAPATGRASSGKSYVVFGRTGLGSGGAVELSSLDGTTGFTLNGDKSGDYSGVSVSIAGDVNGDRVDDLLIGAWQADPSMGRESAGKTYLVFGGTNLGSGGTVELSSLDGRTGFTLNGDKGNDYSGYSVSTAGDVNGDGVDDLLIGAYNAAPATGRDSAGKTYVVFGRRFGMPFPSSSPQTTPAITSLLPDSTSEKVTTTRLESTITSVFTRSGRGRGPTAASVDSSDPSLALPLGIAGGVCAVISSIGAAVFAFRRCRQTPLPDPERQNPPSETVASQSLPTPNYGQLKLHPKCHTHYVGDEELQVFNREREQYESTKAVNASGYANLLQNQPSGYSDLEQLNREHDEYESARLTRAQANDDDIPK